MKHCCQYGQSKWHRDPLPDLIDDGGGGGGGGGKKKSFWSFLSPPVLGMTARGGAAVPMTAKTQAMTPTVGKEEGKDYLEDSVDAASYKRVDHKNIV